MTRPFRFEQFTISQANAPMKVGTDGVLLGAWVSCSKAVSALDIGTGTGLIALILAQRNRDLNIDAIEPNQAALRDAKMNIENSKWEDRIALIDTCLEEMEIDKHFDLIVSNPPFFLYDLKSPDEGRSMARHAETFDYCAFAKASELLNPGGILAGIYPVDIFENFQDEAQKYGIFPQRICEVKPTPQKNPHRVLFEYGNQKVDILPRETLVIESHGRHGYSPEYKELTRDFYLNF